VKGRAWAGARGGGREGGGPQGIGYAGDIVHFSLQASDLGVVLLQGAADGVFEGVDLGKVRKQGQDVFDLQQTPCLPHEVVDLVYALALQADSIPPGMLVLESSTQEASNLGSGISARRLTDTSRIWVQEREAPDLHLGPSSPPA